jgi:hypothetical protein
MHGSMRRNGRDRRSEADLFQRGRGCMAARRRILGAQEKVIRNAMAASHLFQAAVLASDFRACPLLPLGYVATP